MRELCWQLICYSVGGSLCRKLGGSLKKATAMLSDFRDRLAVQLTQSPRCVTDVNVTLSSYEHFLRVVIVAPYW